MNQVRQIPQIPLSTITRERVLALRPISKKPYALENAGEEGKKSKHARFLRYLFWIKPRTRLAKQEGRRPPQRERGGAGCLNSPLWYSPLWFSCVDIGKKTSRAKSAKESARPLSSSLSRTAGRDENATRPPLADTTLDAGTPRSMSLRLRASERRRSSSASAARGRAPACLCWVKYGFN